MKSTLILFLGLVTLAHGQVTRGPYLQMPDTNGVMFVWRTATATATRIEFGLTRECSNNVGDSAFAREHAIQLNDLLPGTNYFYRIEGTVHELRTRRTPEQPVRFAVIGDFGERNPNAAAIARGVNRADIDLLLTVGDNVYPMGERKNYDPHWFRPYAPVMSRVPCFPVLGNHDVQTESGQPFIDNFWLPLNGPAGLTERNYSFDYGNAHFVAIDSNPFAALHPLEMSEITKWVARDLAATKQPWKFAYFHHPGYSSESEHGETKAIHDRLMPILEAGGVQMVFCGHNHFYERIQPIHGLVEIITGGGGKSLYKIKRRADYSAATLTERYSFTLIEVAGQELHLQQVDDAGAVFDTLKLTLPSR